MGSAPCPQVRRYRYSGSRTQSGRRKLFGSPQAPRCIWGVPHAPKTDAAAIRGAEPNQKDASYLGVPKPHISDGVYLGECPSPEVYMGSAPCPQDRRCRYSGECPNPNQKDASYLGVPKPHISDGVYLGECPSPEVYMGSAPCPQDRRCRYSGECPSPNQKDASYLGVPKPHISDGVYLGDAQAPRCLWGVPHAPKTDAAAIRGAEPNFTFSLFTFHFSSHSP